MDKEQPTSITFLDLEVDPKRLKVLDYGAIKSDGSKFHSTNAREFKAFINGSTYICGHNLIAHDQRFISHLLDDLGISSDYFIDTLLLSPLLFPKRPYHRLLKDKQFETSLNNPLEDSMKAFDLYLDEIKAFSSLDEELKCIYYLLLQGTAAFRAFFTSIGFTCKDSVERLILKYFKARICDQVDLRQLIQNNPIELAYALANINTNDSFSLLPAFILHQYPATNMVLNQLRSVKCTAPCSYCDSKLDPLMGLKTHFSFDSFRLFGGKPLQEDAVRSALQGHSLLAIFPTGGGKSITFQLPALMQAEAEKGMTLVISPLQSLMKDQVDNLELAGIHQAVTINGLIDPLERKSAIERITDGSASILYISPESLRSRTIEKLLLKRHVSRVVIDEAHCFSAWGQDFRVDYLYIGKFLKQLQDKKQLDKPIPISCFTATAKPSVIKDICDYFKKHLNLTLEQFSSDATRTNLSYKVLIKETEQEKYQTLRSLIEAHNCPSIIYVNRTQKAELLASQLNRDGLVALPYHGQMDSRIKTENQEKFISSEIDIIVATSAFGMGVDKKDVGLVIHYEISNSLENYVQEAGRAGRDQSIQAVCYILFSEQDLDKHFMLLNQTKLNFQEIQQIWRAIKRISGKREQFSQSALELARLAGWDDSIYQIETRVTTAISALEEAGYLRRSHNAPRIYADSITCRSVIDARKRFESIDFMNDKEKDQAIRILGKLISSKNKNLDPESDAESRVDYIADQLALTMQEAIQSLNHLRSAGLLADTKDLVVYIDPKNKLQKSRNALDRYFKLEHFLWERFNEEESYYSIKSLNDEAERQGIYTSTMHIQTILRYCHKQKHIRYQYRDGSKRLYFAMNFARSRMDIRERYVKRHEMAHFTLDYLETRLQSIDIRNKDEVLIDFSIHDLLAAYQSSPRLTHLALTIEDVEETLLFLQTIAALHIEGGFLVLYNPMTIKRLEMSPHRRFRQDEYQTLKNFYQSKIEQIHIVGEYAKIMVDDYDKALHYVNDYFTMEYQDFIKRYFKGKEEDILRNITKSQFDKLFTSLSPTQLKIVLDKENQHIAVLAGPGSGKTRILVHKLASLALLEDVKSEQLLTLTFSRSAATEFKTRLRDMIGNAAYHIEINTFHAYCLDLLGKTGEIDNLNEAIPRAVESIQNGEIDSNHITKAVLLIDEAQDMDQDSYRLIQALMDVNPDMRVIAVGDDDQNIYEFRGSSAKYLKYFMSSTKAKVYELLTNYRSRKNLVSLADLFARRIQGRLKTNPLQANTSSNGEIVFVSHLHKYLSVPLILDFIEHKVSGTRAILTRTNEEASLVHSLLKKNGLEAKLIQSNEGFQLNTLAEVVYFIQVLKSMTVIPTISRNDFLLAMERLKARYKRSKVLASCLALLKQFIASQGDLIYISDFLTFIRESKAEDAVLLDKEDIVVGTMHKSKGREFHHVYLLLDRYKLETNEECRLLYVAMTRARQSLTVHYNQGILDQLYADQLSRYTCSDIHLPAKELILQCTHKDVYLNHFKKKSFQNIQGKIESGDMLDLTLNNEIRYQGIDFLHFSQSFKKDILRLQEQGYSLQAAYVKYIVHWYAERDDKTYLITLPELHFVKDLDK